MKDIFKPGDQKEYRKTVEPEDTARFENGEVHPFYGTFALGRDAEWAGRLFVLEMKEYDEEGIGTFLNITHHSPAMVGDEVIITSTVEKISGTEIITSFEAKKAHRLIAGGTTGQRILKKTKLEQIKEKFS